jgi:hypothetical protein
MNGVEPNWDIVDAVARSPLFSEGEVEPGIDLAAVERALLASERISAHERERLLLAARELARVFRRLDADLRRLAADP